MTDLAHFETTDIQGHPVTDASVRASAPILIVLLRGLA